jgi:hypothetical protein
MSLPAQLLGALLLLAVLFMGGYFLGKSDGRIDCMAEQASAQQAAQTKVDETNTRREQVAQSREVVREQIRVVYRTIREKVDENVKKNPAYNDCGLDAGSLLNWNAANAGDAATLPGEPDYGLPGAASGQVGQVGGLVPQPRRGNGAVYPVPRSAEETGGVQQQ